MKKKLLIITLFFLAGICLLGWPCLFECGEHIYKIELWGFVGLVVMVLILSLVEPALKKGRFKAVLSKILSWLIMGMYFIVALCLPVLSFIAGFIILVLFPIGLPGILLTFASGLFGWKIGLPLLWFLSLSLGSIAAVYVSKPLNRYFHKLTHMNGHKYEDFLYSFAVQPFAPGNLKVYINVLYCLFLMVSTFLSLYSSRYLISAEADMAILRSFLVFLAFSNIVDKSRTSFNLSIDSWFDSMEKMLSVHDSDDD